jgi:hypothetical protein
VPDTEFMARDKKQQPAKDDRHKPGSRLVRVRPQLIAPLEQLADINVTDFTETVHSLLVEGLRRRGLLPGDAAPED